MTATSLSTFATQDAIAELCVALGPDPASSIRSLHRSAWAEHERFK